MRINSKFCLYIALALVVFASLFARDSSKDNSKNVVSQKPKPKPEARFVLLTQGSAFEQALASSARKGIKEAIEFLAAQKNGFAKTRITFAEKNLSETAGIEEVKQLLSESAVVFAVLDSENSYLLAQVAKGVAAPLIFLNDGPMRTCSVDDPSQVAPTIWQTGLTDSQAVEPFLIHLAETLKTPKSDFQFSFFSTDAIRPRAVTDIVSDNVSALGFEVVEDQVLDVRITDFYKPLRKILAVSADVLFFSVKSEYTQRLLEQTKKMLIYKDFSLASLWLLPEEQLAQLGDSADRIRTVSRYSPSIVDKDLKPASDRLVWDNPGVAKLNTAMELAAYITVQLLQKAAVKAAGVDGASLNAGLQLVTLSTPQTNVWFNRENHVLLQPLYSVQVDKQGYNQSVYLGDIEHPGLEHCSNAIYKALEEQEAAPSVPKYQ